ncbi:unnamed protein product [Rhizoctonia solani]|uniref:Uncharacterized protein n=1 Tax=Rhizoctonia solani TaxID=456999 RepID=A0A8H3DCU9_9AGAM|nr:unnamed protein product [Rhizoctonia solani]
MAAVSRLVSQASRILPNDNTESINARLRIPNFSDFLHLVKTLKNVDIHACHRGKLQAVVQAEPVVIDENA